MLNHRHLLSLENVSMTTAVANREFHAPETEFWLPMSGWNRKLQSVGNGAWAGVNTAST